MKLLLNLGLTALLLPVGSVFAEVLYKTAAQYSSLNSPMVIQTTTTSPTGARVHTTTANNGEVIYEFELDAPSKYEVEALLFADVTYRNTLAVSANSGPVIEWEVAPNPSAYEWRKLDQEFIGNAGIQQIHLYGRETYVRIAAVRITKIVDPIIPAAPAASRFDSATGFTIVNATSFSDAATKALAAAPNTKVVLPSGTFSGVNVTLRGNGTQSGPIIIEGQPDGSTILTGQILMTIKGSYILVRNLNVQNFDSTNINGGMITFDTCAYCGLHNSRFDTSVAAVMNSDNEDTKHFKTIRIKPSSQSVEISRNSFINKRNAGSSVLIDRDINRTSFHEGHRVFLNLFLDRKLEVNNANDFDSIRVGSSGQSHTPSMTDAETLMTGENAKLVGNTIEFNVFEGTRIKDSAYASCLSSGSWNSSACKGEPEIISIKAPQTIVRFNTFRNNSGGLTLRHGYMSIIEGNYFGGPMQASYGVRVIDQNHLVMNNHMENLSFSSDLMGGISVLPGNTTSSLAEYFPVLDAIISGNFIKNVSNKPVSLASDYGVRSKTILPEHIVFSQNVVSQCSVATINQAPDQVYLASWVSYENLFDCTSWGTTLAGATQIPYATTVTNNGFSLPTEHSLVSILGVLYNTEEKHEARLAALEDISGSAASERMNKLSQFLSIKLGTLYDNYQPQNSSSVGSSF